MAQSDLIVANPKLDGGDVLIYSTVYGGLRKASLSENTAKKYAYFAVEIYLAVLKDSSVRDALEAGKGAMKGALPAAKQMFRAPTMGASGGRVAAYGVRGIVGAFEGAGGGGVSILVDRFAAIAEHCEIELNKCTIEITKVVLDGISVAILSAEVVTILVGAMAALSTFDDVAGLVAACS